MQSHELFLRVDITHYFFLFYIFLLLCAAAVLCKFLFSDVKRQNKLLDEKETKLLKLYSTLEDAMDDFYDNVETSKGELSLTLKKIREELRTPPPPAEPEPEIEPPPKKSSRKSARGAAKSAPEPDFGEVLREAEEANAAEEAIAPAYSKHDGILHLNERGLSPVEIAKELGITLAEVQLVIGINKQSSPGI